MRSFLELLAPPTCASCGATTDGDLCIDCANHIVVLGDVGCDRCGAPVRADTRPCPCAALGGFDRARSLVSFAEPAARSLTLALKRRGSRQTTSAIGTLIAELALATGLFTGSETLTFVPGGRSATVRGFDHAELIARAATRRLGSRCVPLLTRASEGPRQADVQLVDRRSNVAGRFSSRAASGRILLVDDVFTTGATAEACALALRDAGASSIDVVTWARTTLRRGAA